MAQESIIQMLTTEIERLQAAVNLVKGESNTGAKRGRCKMNDVPPLLLGRPKPHGRVFSKAQRLTQRLQDRTRFYSGKCCYC
jgi:hypothetical protein